MRISSTMRRSAARVGTVGLAAACLFAARPLPARAIPRFAARTGMECIECHMNPSGGGMRNEFGRNVFERAMLPMGSFDPRWLDVGAPPALGATAGDAPAADAASAPPAEGAGDAAGGEAAAASAQEPAEGPSDPAVSFSGNITEWLAVGADFRAAYIYIRPDRGAMPDTPRNITSSFFLMQSDLYTGATLNDNVRLVVDIGVYSGFEAWGLFNATNDPEVDLYVKVGRFMPTYGIREVEHQLFTREGIGIGTSDRDTGIELTAFLGPVTASLAVVNGTLGDTPFDSHGTERRTFEKALVSRVALRMHPGPFRLQLGGSFYFNDDVSQPNPLFGRSIPPALAADAATGLDEVRAGVFVTANLGRVTYLGDLDWVHDSFYAQTLDPISGYASYQELSFTITNGLDLIGTFEFMDPDMDLADNQLLRAGVVLEAFPWPFVELRAMVRRLWADRSPTGGSWDAVLFAHLFM